MTRLRRPIRFAALCLGLQLGLGPLLGVPLWELLTRRRLFAQAEGEWCDGVNARQIAFFTQCVDSAFGKRRGTVSTRPTFV